MVANEPPQSARIIAGRYRLGSRLGSSFQAAVFDAFDEQMQRSVVLKLVHPDLSAMPELQRSFEQTMVIAAGLHHPNIAAVYDSGRSRWNDREVLYVAAERMVGGSLRDLLDRGRLLSASQALVVGLDACKALDAMHRAGLVHTDIRPATLVFGDDRRLRVVDVGLAQVLHQTAGDVAARSVDRVKYTSPEEAQGQPVQPKSDVYSLCLALLEAVTGSVPFTADSAVSTLAKRVDRLMPVSADFGQLAAVFERAGRPDASTRYTAAEFGRALVQSAEQMPRPEPLPILVNSLFAPDSGGAGQPVEPTGPLVRPITEPVELMIVAADEADQPQPDAASVVEEAVVAESPAPVEPVATAPIDVAPPSVAVVPTPLPPPLPSAAAVLAPPPQPVAAPPAVEAVPPTIVPPTIVPPTIVPPSIVPGTVVPDAVVPDGVDEEFDPDDEFPDHPPAVRGGRRWFIALLAVLALGGGALAWQNTRPDTSTVPDLTGMRQGEALNQIGSFKAAIEEEPNETVASGVVVRTEPAAGTTLEHGKTVTIFVSTGPAPRALPELAGLTVPEATAALTELGLVIIVSDPVPDEVVLPGVIISWSVPAAPTLTAGATVIKGTTVQVVASSGPAPRVVPDLTNLTIADATAALQALGLVYAQLPDEFSNTVPVGSVIRQDLPPGSEAARGATVVVAVSMGPDLVAMPSLSGLDYNGIVAAIQGAGLTVGTVTGDTTQPFESATASGSQVVDGQQLLRGTPVDLTFAPTPVVTTVV
ncbi:MAG TPA: PASTA domain-containing protein [Ilumatobacteraceae bacterium]|nr:PASTA domain-containing protein [Ilumatobacteraceae bacterium]